MCIIFHTYTINKLRYINYSNVEHCYIVGNLSLLENMRERKKSESYTMIFLTAYPGTVYTDPVTKMKYFAKVAFKLMIDPEFYRV